MAIVISPIIQSGGINEFAAPIFKEKPSDVLISRKMGRLE
jgi:membrane protein CcdC involved in cytochrome C biogenesis